MSTEYVKSNEYIENVENNKSDIIKNIKNNISSLVEDIDMMINDIKNKNNNTLNLENFENISKSIINIKKMISDNNINMDKISLEALDALEELNNLEYKNEYLLKIGTTVYKKGISNKLNNSSLRNSIINKNFNNDILDKIINNNLIARFQERIYIMSFNDEL
jgi:hypothetical protein